MSKNDCLETTQGDDRGSLQRTSSCWRILDANLNRTQEGLRVIEDFFRFHIEDPHLTGVCKQLRHELADAFATLPQDRLIAARSTLSDIGTALSTEQERERREIRDVAVASFKRIQQSFRCLEEYSKLVDTNFALKLESLRYQAYTLERASRLTVRSRDQLKGCLLYVLIDGADDISAFSCRVEELVAAGVHVLQLRDKGLDDRELLVRAKIVRARTKSTSTLFIVNDRPDLAMLANADGVHLGQEDFSVHEARRIVGPDRLIGVSTHHVTEACQSVLDGANYLGVGPVFPSTTKSFDFFPGLELLRQVAREIKLPAFAIGGINSDNLPQVLHAGFTRIAVSGAIFSGGDVTARVNKFHEMLDERN